MKLQGLSIMFTLICIPLLLVLSYYLSLQVDTIRLQNRYDTKLLDATYDALSAFELNTANEDLSTVSDSLRTIIDASNSIFFNTLATNMGLSNASKSYVEPYIPAILYTLYDGYYIYSPTSVPEMATSSDGTAIKVGDDGVSFETTSGFYLYRHGGSAYGSDASITYLANSGNKKEDYGQLLYLTNTSKKTYDEDGKISEYTRLTTDVDDAKKSVKSVLKSYMPYSARYVGMDNSSRNQYDYTIVYTLDNYMTVEGYTIFQSDDSKKVYYTESGYLLNDQYINIIVRDKATNTNIGVDSLNQNTAQEKIENGEIIVDINIRNNSNGDDVKISTDDLRTCDALIDEFKGCYDLDNPDDDSKNKLLLLTVKNAEDWGKKTEIQKYESLMTILKNKATEYEESIRNRRWKVQKY